MSDDIFPDYLNPKRILSPEDWLFAALISMVIEHCSTLEKDKLDSYRWKSNETAMRLLAEAGFIEIERETPEKITARTLPLAYELIQRTESKSV